jgi:hypothetical protein
LNRRRGRRSGGAAFVVTALTAASLALACQRAAPASRFPNARALIERMRETHACSRGVEGEGVLDYLGDDARVRAKTLYVVSRPTRIRFDVLSPLGGVLSTLTSDGEAFSFFDSRQAVFLKGRADECNVEQALRVPVPPAALSQLLVGVAPILSHDPGDASLEWSGGQYLIQIASRHAATESVRVVPRDEDWERPWSEQRVRVLDVEVSQQQLVLYRAELSQHQAAPSAEPRVDPDGLEPDIMPSGPVCHAEVPRHLRFVVPGAGRDIVFRQESVRHNPPLTAGVFRQEPPPGVRRVRSNCPR